MQPTLPSPDASADGCFYVGTSGYAYTEWVEAGFYPPGTSANRMLPLYARQFPATELNYTWYQMPKAQVIERQRRQAPTNFVFAAKLTRTLTHEIDSQKWPLQAAEYREGIAPLRQSGQLGAVLVQLPPSFNRTPSRRAHLAVLLDELADLPLAVEFRHRSWANDRVFAELERRRITLVTVDAPALPGLFPTLDVVTNRDLCYIRFHGRNAQGWRSGSLQRQFDYTYSEDQLQEWIQKTIVPMSGRTKRGLLFFNNHVRGQATENARQLIRLLKQQGLTVI